MTCTGHSAREGQSQDWTRSPSRPDPALPVVFALPLAPIIPSGTQKSCLSMKCLPHPPHLPDLIGGNSPRPAQPIRVTLGQTRCHRAALPQ